MDFVVDETTGFLLAIGGLLLLAAPDQDDFYLLGHTFTTAHVALGLIILGLVLITTSHNILG